MGLFVRKAIDLGLLRVNLSKSGVGLSVQVPGGRISKNTKSQDYIDIGTGVLRYRKASKRKKKQKS